MAVIYNGVSYKRVNVTPLFWHEQTHDPINWQVQFSHRIGRLYDAGTRHPVNTVKLLPPELLSLTGHGYWSSVEL